MASRQGLAPHGTLAFHGRLRSTAPACLRARSAWWPTSQAPSPIPSRSTRTSRPPTCWGGGGWGIPDTRATSCTPYAGQQLLQVDNGNDECLKQYVWGFSTGASGSYVDELVQIGINQDPGNKDEDGGDDVDVEDEDLCERFFWVCQDANFNVLGVLSAAGDLVERYEYTPYGRRTIFSRGWLLEDATDDGVVEIGQNDPDYLLLQGDWGDPVPWSRADFNGDGNVSSADLSMLNGADGNAIAADPLVTHPTLSSSRGRDRNGVAVTGLALCDHGHQGLLHDREFGLVYNRARYLHPRLQRFTQRDPLGYIDGMGLYEYVRSGPGTWLDPMGLGGGPMEEGRPYVQVRANNEVWIRRTGWNYKVGVKVDHDGTPHIRTAGGQFVNLYAAQYWRGITECAQEERGWKPFLKVYGETPGGKSDTVAKAKKAGCKCILTVRAMRAGLQLHGSEDEFMTSWKDSCLAVGHAWVRLDVAKNSGNWNTYQGGHTGEEGWRTMPKEWDPRKASLRYAGPLHSSKERKYNAQYNPTLMNLDVSNSAAEALASYGSAARWSQYIITDSTVGKIQAGLKARNLSHVINDKAPILWLRYEYEDGRWHKGQGKHFWTDQCSYCLPEKQCDRIHDKMDAYERFQPHADIRIYGGFHHGCGNTVQKLMGAAGLTVKDSRVRQNGTTFFQVLQSGSQAVSARGR